MFSIRFQCVCRWVDIKKSNSSINLPDVFVFQIESFSFVRFIFVFDIFLSILLFSTSTTLPLLLVLVPFCQLFIALLFYALTNTL